MPAPLPDRPTLLAQLATVEVVEDGVDGDALVAQRSELEDYRRQHAARLGRSLRIVADLGQGRRPLRILELGAAPYYFTALLLRYLDAEVIGVNTRAAGWPGPTRESGVEETRVVLRQRAADGGLREDAVETWVLNLERDPYPFDDGAFDVVLFMETIEHLVYSPSHVLGEAGRVLAPDGALVVTTPNQAAAMKTLKMVCNRSIAFPYSGYGAYGRHNREFMPSELRALLTACGYGVETLRLENPYHAPTGSRTYDTVNRVLAALTALPLPWLRGKRQYMYAVGRRTPHVRAAYPPALYTMLGLYPDVGEAPAE